MWKATWLLHYTKVFTKVPAMRSPPNYKWPDDKLPKFASKSGFAYMIDCRD